MTCSICGAEMPPGDHLLVAGLDKGEQVCSLACLEEVRRVRAARTADIIRVNDQWKAWDAHRAGCKDCRGAIRTALAFSGPVCLEGGALHTAWMHAIEDTQTRAAPDPML